MSEETRVDLQSHVDDAISELEERFEEIYAEDPDSPHDAISEIADSNVPIHYWNILETAREDLWLATEEPELFAFDGKHTAINAIAGNIYQHLEQELWSRWEELKEAKQDEEHSKEINAGEEGSE